MIEIIDPKPVIKEKKKSNLKTYLIFIGILILIGGILFISEDFFDDGLGEPTYGSKEHYQMLNTYEGDNNDILEISDLHGEITTYPAVAEIKWSSSDGWLPADQYFTFENKKEIPIDNVKIAGRFNGELITKKLYELVSVEKFMVNGSWMDEEGINYTTNYSYFVDEWIKKDVSHAEINNKHIYYIVNNDFKAGEIKTFKVTYLPSINDLSGKWDVVAFIGSASNPDYSIILDPYYNFGSGSSWEGKFVNTRDDGVNLTLDFVGGGVAPYKKSGYLNSSGLTSGASTKWNITIMMPYNYSQAIINTSTAGIHYYLHFNGSQINDSSTGINWTEVSGGRASVLTGGVSGDYWGYGGIATSTDGVNRRIINDDLIENTNISVEFWINVTACATDNCMPWRYTATNGNMYTIRVGNNKVRTQTITIGGSNDISSATLGALNDGNWHHMYVQWGGGTNDFSIDGVKVIDGSFTDYLRGSLDGNINQLFYVDGANLKFSMDEFILRRGEYAYLTQGEIINHFKQGASKVKVQVAYSDTNNTWVGHKNFTETGTFNITNSGTFAKYWVFLDTYNSSVTPYVNYINMSYDESAPLITTTNNFLSNLKFETATGLNRTTEDLTLSFTPIDNNTITPLYFNFSFYNHSILHNQFLNIQGTNNTLFEFDFKSGNTTRGNIWYVEINMSDDDGISNFTTINLTILNTPPIISICTY